MASRKHQQCLPRCKELATEFPEWSGGLIALLEFEYILIRLRRRTEATSWLGKNLAQG